MMAFRSSRLAGFVPGTALLAGCLSFLFGAEPSRPSAPPPDFGIGVPAELSAPEDPPGRPGLHVFMLSGPTQPDWIEELGRLEVAVLQYVPPYGYIVFASAESVSAARRLPYVLSTERFFPSRKLGPRVRELCSEVTRGASSRRVAIVAQLFLLSGAESFRRALEEAGARVWSEVRFLNRMHIRAEVPISFLAAIARWPSVYRVELFPEYRLSGEREAVIVAGAYRPASHCVQPGYREWLARKGLTGEGVIVQVMDDGIDRGDASGAPDTAHPDILGRIAGFDNATSDPLADGIAGHGTLNAGIIVGTGATGVRDAQGFLRGQGVAPGARVFGTKIFANAGYFDAWDRSSADMVAAAVAAGCTVSSNSWGSSWFLGEYDAMAAEFDALVRDAHRAPGPQPLTIVFSAGNEANDAWSPEGTITPPATAKNVICVGASEGCDSEGVDGCGVLPDGADSIRDVIDFSSRGPLRDGRLGPTVVAPGTHVSGIASIAAGYTGDSVCDRYWPPGQTLYARTSGTSVACPFVAGAAALFEEAYKKATGERPSPALLKAAIIAAARDIAGGRDGFGGRIQPAPNNVEGWGLLSLEELLPDADSGFRPVWVDRVLLAKSGDSWEMKALPIGTPLKVALAWTDPPGMPGAQAALVNDLDLEVETGGTLYRGNFFGDGRSAPGGKADRRNNVEVVAIDRPGSDIAVRVVAANIAGDAVAERPGFEQDFALVIQGAVEQSQRAVVAFDRRGYGCGASPSIRLCDLDLAGAGTARVVLTSSAGSSLFLELVETPAASGMFRGTVSFGDGANQLKVADGATIAAAYLDPDDGSGRPAEAKAIASIDCAAPVISNVEIETVGLSSAAISFETSEDAISSLRFGKARPPAEGTEAIRILSAEHRFELRGLDPGAQYFFSLTAEDPAGNSTTADRDGACYFFHTSSSFASFEDDFEPSPLPGWTHGSALGPNLWAVREFGGAHSPSRVWHSSGFMSSMDSWLMTPPLQIVRAHRLTFWHIYEFEFGYDGAVLEISADGGRTWEDLGADMVEGHYDGYVPEALTGYRAAWTGDVGPPMRRVVADLSRWAGADRRIRFRVLCDEMDEVGRGWFIDDVSIGVTTNKLAQISLDRSVYRCKDSGAITLSDSDLRGARSVSVLPVRAGVPIGTPVILLEAISGSGVFEGWFAFGDGPGELPVTHADEVSFVCRDNDTGLHTGPRIATATAVVDCRVPEVSRVRLVEILDDLAKIAWETDELSRGEAFAGEACGLASVRAETPMAGVSHVVTLEPLQPNVTYSFAIKARDGAGNLTTWDANGACGFFTPLAPSGFREGFDGEVRGWTHEALQGLDGWSFVESGEARSPPKACFHPGSEELNDSWISTPPFLVPQGGYFSFWHTYELNWGYDGAVVELSADGGASWLDLGDAFLSGGYNCILYGESPLAGRRAWSGGRLEQMERVVADLERWAGSYVRVRFRLTTAGVLPSGGWYIDQVEVGQTVRQAGRLGFSSPTVRCGTGARLRLLDSGLAGAGKVRVEVRSTSDPKGREVLLEEIVGGSGIFENAVLLSETGAGGALLAKHGDELVASYRDDGDGAAGAREVTARAAVDCVGPRIFGISAESPDGRSAIVSFETDEPAFGRLEFGTSCGAFEVVQDESDPRKFHEFRVERTSEKGLAFFRVSAADLAGNRSLDDAGGTCHRFRARLALPIFEDRMEPAADSGWEAEDPWAVFAGSVARSRPRCWRLSEREGIEEASLYFPPLLVDAPAYLEFWHSYRFSGRLSGGVLELSSDGGETWTDLGGSALEGGYSGVLGAAGPLAGRRAWMGNRAGAMERAVVRLGEALARKPAILRFRYGSHGSSGGGFWAVDDIRVYRTVGQAGAISFRGLAQPCESQARLSVVDLDLVGKNVIEVEVRSSGQVGATKILLAEETTGLFLGSVKLSAQPGAFTVVARDGDTVTARYLDRDDGTGAERVVEASTVVDCAAPGFPRVFAALLGSGGIELLWETSEPAVSHALYGSACSSLSKAIAAPVFGRRFRAARRLPGLGESLQVRFVARDLAGNRANAPAGSECFGIAVTGSVHFEDRFEPPADGWTHAAAVGRDDWRVVVYANSHSPRHSYHAGNDGREKDAFLVSPPLDIPPGAWLSFWHSYELEDGLDFARLEISADGGNTWRDLGAEIYEGGYDIPKNPWFASWGWTGSAMGAMKRVRVPLGGHSGPARRIRFRILCDDSVGSAGWYVDDVAIVTMALGGAGAPFRRGNCNGDSRVNLSDAVFLLDHLFRGGRDPGCLAACDADGDERLNLTDAVYLLNHLFLGGPELPGPESCAQAVESKGLGCASRACTEP